MNTTTKLAGGAVAACAACCAVSIVPVLFAGTSLLAIGGASSVWGIGVAALAVPVAALYLFSRRRPAATGAAKDLIAVQSCGCGSCAPTEKLTAPIACTLDARDFKQRAASIRDLAHRSLRHASRTPLSLTLTYETRALGEVRELVRKERACCAFLDFDLKNNAEAVTLRITAPSAAADAADMLFDHFAPDRAASNTKEIA